MAANGWSPEAVANYDELFAGLSRVLGLNLKLGFGVAGVFLAYSFFKLLRRMFTGP